MGQSIADAQLQSQSSDVSQKEPNSPTEILQSPGQQSLSQQSRTAQICTDDLDKLQQDYNCQREPMFSEFVDYGNFVQNPQNSPTGEKCIDQEFNWNQQYEDVNNN